VGVRRTAVVVGAIVFAALLAGCGAPGLRAAPPRPDAVPVDAVVCPETYEEGYAQAGGIPDGFEPVALLRCDPWASGSEADGTDAGALLERFEGDLTPVLDALATPDDPAPEVCPAIGYMLPELWLEGGDGTVVRAAYPSAGCGPKDVGLDAAIASLTPVSERFVR